MLFDPALMEQLPPAPHPQPTPLPSSGGSGAGDGFAFFGQTDGLPVDEAVASGGQPQQQPQPPPVSSQISQLLSPSPVQQTPRSDAPRSKAASIEEALLLSAPELELLTGSDDTSGVVEGSEQSINGPPPPGRVFDSDPMKVTETPNILFPSSDDLRTIPNLADVMQDSTSGDLLPSATSVQKPFCPLKDIEASAALFLQE